jgi:hypothetical protein
MGGSAIPDPLGRRVLPTVAVIVTTVLVLAACSGSDSGGALNAGGSANPSSAVGYSVCVRSRGVPNFPDPDSYGELPKADAQHLGVSTSQLQEAQRACQHLLPSSGGVINADSIQQCMLTDDCPQPLVLQVRTEELGFARCMRLHGVPNWPDPIIDSQGRPVFAISISKDGFDPYSPQIWAKGNDCSYLMPGLPGMPAAVSP